MDISPSVLDLIQTSLEQIGLDRPTPDPEQVTYVEGWPCYREHSLFESAVTEAARELQVSREMAMMCAFGAMATACQGQVDVEMPTGHRVPASLMLLTIADSGERKTTVQRHFFKAIENLNQTAHQAAEQARVEHRVEYQRWHTQKRHLERLYNKHAMKSDEAGAAKALEALTEHARAEPQLSPSGKFLYEDSTPQALVQMLHEHAPNACLLTSEANSIFRGRVLSELDKLNTLWDGGSVIVDRVSKEGFMLQNARLTLSLMAQPSVMARFMDKRGEEARGMGFLARFLVVKPRPMAGQRTLGQLSGLPRLQAFNERVRERLSVPASDERQVLRFSEAAANLWYQYGQYLEQQMQDNGLYRYHKDHASKLLETTSRLAAILHAFERHSADDTEIDRFTLMFCWDFARACSQHFTRYLADEPQIITDANNLVHYLLALAYKNTPPEQPHQASALNHNVPPPHLRPGAYCSFTLTQLKQYGPNSLRGRANAERLEAAIDLLTQLGHVSKRGSFYRFQETVLLKHGEPPLKNGEIVTIKELPLFSEQFYYQPERSSGLDHSSGYYLPSQP